MKGVSFGLILLSLIIGGCSNEQVYTAVQQNRQFDCQKLPQSQYEDCMKDYDQSYEEYARERKELLDSSK